MRKNIARGFLLQLYYHRLGLFCLFVSFLKHCSYEKGGKEVEFDHERLALLFVLE
jgi:hypothetical protein